MVPLAAAAGSAASGRGSGVAAAPAAGGGADSSVQALLDELGLSQYTKALEEAGLDELSYLQRHQRLPLQELLLEIGMRKGHALRLLERLESDRAHFPIFPAGDWMHVGPERLRSAMSPACTSPPAEGIESPRMMSMSHSALYLEDRLKTVSLAIVAVVTVAFVCWYLQSVLKLVTFAMLLAVLLEPIVDFLSLPPELPPHWLNALKSGLACDAASRACPDSARVISALADFICAVRLPRGLAILITLLLVWLVGSLLVVILYDTIYQFVDNIQEYVQVGEQFVTSTRLVWKRWSIGEYLDIDALLNAVLAYAGDTSFLQGVLVQSVSLIGALVANMIVCMIMWIFLVMNPPPAAHSRDCNRRLGVNRPQSAQAQTRIYLRWKAAISLGKAVASGILFLSLALPLWPIVAILVFWLNWIPVFGSIVAIALPVPLALADPHMDWIKVTVLIALPTAMHLLVDNLVDVQVMARAMMLHPLSIMLGLLTAKILWGISGMILSVPLLAALKTNLAGTAHPYARALALALEGKWREAAVIGSGEQLPAPLTQSTRLSGLCQASCREEDDEEAALGGPIFSDEASIIHGEAADLPSSKEQLVCGDTADFPPWSASLLHVGDSATQTASPHDYENASVGNSCPTRVQSRGDPA